VVGLLLEAGANPTVRNNTDKTTPLERAQEYLRRDPEADEIKKIINLLTATK